MPTKYNIWIVAVGEPLPIDGPDERLLRAGLLARTLVARGHTVTWWTSAFDHRTKRFRDHPERFESGQIRYRLLRGTGYRRNVSLKRIRDQREVAKAFTELVKLEADAPDVLFVAYPTAELAEVALNFASDARRPVVIDVRDFWPDIFSDALPKLLRPVASVALRRMKRQSSRVLAGATAITGITESFVDWGVERGGRSRTESDRSFPLAFDQDVLSPDALVGAEASLESRGITAHDNRFRIVFAGSLSKQFDFQPLLDAAAELRDSPITFSIAGSGEMERFLRKQAAGHDNIQLLGWLNRLELRALLNRATVGIAPYRSTWDFQASIPNKVIEYLASGLAVVSSLEGEVASLLATEECGVTYQSSNGRSLGTVLRALLADRQKLERMRANARSVFLRKFSGADIYPAMADFLEDLAGRRRSLKLGDANG